MKKLFLDRELINKWTKRAAIISAVIFIISLVGMLAGTTLPTEVEKEVSLFSYAHNGRFDYLVYLKPSYLFGPEPTEEPEAPPNPQYPRALIEDEMDIIFRYETDAPLLQEVKQGVKVEAILEHEELWQKVIEMVPTTDETGSFKVEFVLDLDDIDELFDTIDEETEIPTSTRVVTIVATVGLGEGLEAAGSFVQSLPITLKKSTIEIGGELVQMVMDDTGGVEARGTFDYTLYLEENSLYDTDTVKPPQTPPNATQQPQTLGVGPVIPYELVDRMDTSYYYNFNASGQLKDLTQEVTITATLDNPDLWSKTFVLVPSTKQTDNVRVKFPLDIIYLNELLTAIRTETGTSGEAYSLVIEAFVHVTADTDYGPIDETFTQTLSTQLGGGTLIWNEELEMTQEGAITTTYIIPNDNRYLGLSVDGLKTTSLVLGIVFLLIFIASLVFYNQTKPAELPLFEKTALVVGKKYADRIAEASSQTPLVDEKIISLESMEDLVKIADELGKPIMHQPPTAMDKRHIYYVIDGISQYQYIIAKQTKERRSHVGKSEWF